MEDLTAYEAEVHELCGLHESIAAENPDMTFDSNTCPNCADVAAGLRVLAEADRKEAEAMKDRPGERRKADGRRWLIRSKTPDEINEAAKRQPRGRAAAGRAAVEAEKPGTAEAAAR